MNMLIIKGRLTRDVELKYAQSGIAVGKSSIAVDDGYGDKKKVFFFNFVSFKKTAELISTHFKKGNEILLTGKLTQSKWTDKNGVNKTSNDILVTSFDFCGYNKKDDNNNSQSQNQSNKQSQDQQQNPNADFPEFDDGQDIDDKDAPF